MTKNTIRIQALYGSNWIDVIQLSTTVLQSTPLNAAIWIFYQDWTQVDYDYGIDIPLLKEDYTFIHFFNMMYRPESTQTEQFSLDMWTVLYHTVHN